jgi:hypothetical protein
VNGCAGVVLAAMVGTAGLAGPGEMVLMAARGQRAWLRGSALAMMAGAVVAGVCPALLPGTGAAAAIRVAGGARVTSLGSAWGRARPVPGAAALNNGDSQLLGLSCGSPGNCAAGGYYTDSAGREQPFVVSEVRGTWQAARQVPGVTALGQGQGGRVAAVSCAVSGYCAAGGYYWTAAGSRQAFVVTEVRGRWGSAEEVPGTGRLNKGGDAALAAVSCPSAGNCAAGGHYEDTATDVQAFIVSEHQGIWQQAREVPGSAALNGGGAAETSTVSCSSAGNCGAGGYISAPGLTSFVVTEQNGRWHRAELVPGLAALNTGSYGPMSQMACPSAGNCTAGGAYSANGAGFAAYVVSEVHGVWQQAREIPGFAVLNQGQRDGYLNSLSCGSAGNCSAVGQYTDSSGRYQAFVASEQHGRWGRSGEAPGTAALNQGGYATLGEVSCPAPGQCSAGGRYTGRDGHAHAFVIGQADGIWGTAEQVAGSAALDQGGDAQVDVLSCASPGHCSAAGSFSTHPQLSQVFVVGES